MAIDLIFMGSSADRSAADVALPIAAGELQVTGNGAPGTGTQWYPKANGAILGAFVRSETAAMVECWFNKTTDPNRNKVRHMAIQTDPVGSQSINYLNYPIEIGSSIQAAGENAGNVLDVLGLYVAKRGGEYAPIPFSSQVLPAGAIPVRATSTFTHVADTVAEGTIVFDDFTPLRDVVYQIIGLSADSATGCGTRLRFLEGTNKDDTPGVPCADTSTALEYAYYMGDFGSFKGQTPPRCQTIAVGADAVTNLFMILLPQGTQGGR